MCVEGEEVVGEEVRMELKFLYAVDSEEAQDAITASNQQYHIGLGKCLPSHSVLLQSTYIIDLEIIPTFSPS